MARIKGIEIKDSWRVIYALTQVKGIGWSIAEKILGNVKINLEKRVKDLSADELNSLSAQVDTYVTEGDLVRQVHKNIARLQAIGAYRGVRHNRRLPVRGQRTKSNARSRRGERKTVGSFRKEVLTKMQQTK